MKRLHLLFIGLFSVTAVVILLATFTPPVRADEVSGDIDTDTAWTLANSPYVMTDTVTILAGVTLTIEAGVEVQAESGTTLSVLGNLVGQGSPGQPITITSVAQSAAGDWQGITVGSTGMVSLTQVVVSYGLRGVFLSGANTQPVQLQSVTLRLNDYAINVRPDALHQLQMSDVSFAENTNDRVKISVTGANHDLAESVILTPQTGLEGYQLGENHGYLVIPESITLTLEAGTTILTPDSHLNVYGHLQVNGTSTDNVVITSENGNPDPNSGSNAYLNGTANINHATISGGYVGLGVSPENVYISNTTFISNYYGLSLGYTTGEFHIANSSFSKNEWPIITAVDTIHFLQMDNVTFEDNVHDRVRVGVSNNTYELVANVTLRPQPGLEGYEIYGNHTFYVPAGITLTLESGVKMYMGHTRVVGHLQVNGTDTENVVITSREVGSGPTYNTDTAIEGTANINHAVFSRGSVALLIYNNVHISHTTFISNYVGVQVAAETVIENSTFAENEWPIVVEPNDLHQVQMDNLMFENNVHDRVGIDVDANNELAGNVTLKPQLGLEGYELFNYPSGGGNHLYVPEGITLTIEPGVNMYLGHTFINGHLQVNGTSTENVVMTSRDEGSGPTPNTYTLVDGTANINHAVFSRGSTGLWVGQGNVQISHTTFISFLVGMHQDGGAVIENSTFSETEWPIVADVTNLHQLQMDNVTFEDNTHDRVGIHVWENNNELAGNVTLRPQSGLEGYELFNFPLRGNHYELVDNITLKPQPELQENELFNSSSGVENSLYIPVGITLTVEPGVNMYMGHTFVQGHLQVNGTDTENVVITSRDAGSEPSFNTYTYIEGSADINHARFSRGSSGIWVTTGGNAHIANTTFISNYVGLEVLGETVIENSTFTENEWPLWTYADALHFLQLDNVTFNNNDHERVQIQVSDTNDELAGDVTLRPQPGLEGYEVYSSDDPNSSDRLTVPQNITLSLSAGSRLMVPDRLVVNGQLQANGQAGQLVTITSVEDSGPGQWIGIEVDGGEAALNYTELRYGTVNLSALSPTSTLNISHSTVISAGEAGIAVTDGSLNIDCAMITQNGTYGIMVEPGSRAMVAVYRSDIDGHLTAGITNTQSTSVVDAIYNWWGAADGPGGNGPGSGDAIYGQVSYEPWLTEPGCEGVIVPALQPAEAIAVENEPTLTFTVTLNVTSELAISVSYETVDDTAVAGIDYEVVSGTLTISAGETTGFISVPLIDNAVQDGDRQLILQLSQPVNGVLAQATAVGLILDDEQFWYLFMPMVMKP